MKKRSLATERMSNDIFSNSTTALRAVCAIAFCVFAFVYVYFYQADTLSQTQYVLSGGKTIYNRTVGAILIPLVLILVQKVLCRIVSKIDSRFYALTYLPSFLLLAFLTDIDMEVDGHFEVGKWIWGGPILLAVWVMTIIAVSKVLPPKQSFHPFHSALYWSNLSVMCVMMIGVGCLSNSNDVFHYRMKCEHCLMAGDYDKALKVGEKSDKTDASLTMLRVFALAHQGMLGERLFSYPVAGTSSDIVPQTGDARLMQLSPDSVYKMLGAIPRKGMSTHDYINAIVKSGQATDVVVDYRLCGMLIDKDLDGFVQLLVKTRQIDDTLPKHYREALTLYSHRRANPIAVYHNTVMDTDYNDMQKLESTGKSAGERKIKVLEQYSGTYWYYYDYR